MRLRIVNADGSYGSVYDIPPSAEEMYREALTPEGGYIEIIPEDEPLNTGIQE